MKIKTADWVTIPGGVVTSLANLVNLNSELDEIGIKIESGDTVFWSIKQAGAVLSEMPISAGLLTLPMDRKTAEKITFIASANTSFTVLQLSKGV